MLKVWSWALFFCHDAISTVMRKRSSNVRFLRSWLATCSLNRQAPDLAPYVDNANLVALTRESGDKVFTVLVAELRLKGFVL